MSQNLQQSVSPFGAFNAAASNASSTNVTFARHFVDEQQAIVPFGALGLDVENSDRANVTFARPIEDEQQVGVSGVNVAVAHPVVDTQQRTILSNTNFCDAATYPVTFERPVIFVSQVAFGQPIAYEQSFLRRTPAPIRVPAFDHFAITTNTDGVFGLERVQREPGPILLDGIITERMITTNGAYTFIGLIPMLDHPIPATKCAEQVNKTNVASNEDAQTPESAAAIIATRHANINPPYNHLTCHAVGKGSRLDIQAQRAQKFEKCFRKLPTEVREMVFGFVVSSAYKGTPNLIIALRPNALFYREALRAFCLDKTFVLHARNLTTLDQASVDYMHPQAWATVRKLKIEHIFMRRTPWGQYHQFAHARSDFVSYFSPCGLCDMDAIYYAKNLRVLHLDFSSSKVCILGPLLFIINYALDGLVLLERLVLEISNIECSHSEEWDEKAISTINARIGRKGKLLTVGMSLSSFGPDSDDYASESWFWQADNNGLLYQGHYNSAQR